MRSDSLCVIPKNSRTSPAQSSGRSSKSWIVAASWAMNTCSAQAITADRAAVGAHRKAGLKWWARRERADEGPGSSKSEWVAQRARRAVTSMVGSSVTKAKIAWWCSRMSRQVSSVARSRGVAPFLRRWHAWSRRTQWGGNTKKSCQWWAALCKSYAVCSYSLYSIGFIGYPTESSSSIRSGPAATIIASTVAASPLITASWSE